MIKIMANLAAAEQLIAPSESQQSDSPQHRKIEFFSAFGRFRKSLEFQHDSSSLAAGSPVGRETVHDLGSLGKPDGRFRP